MTHVERPTAMNSDLVVPPKVSDIKIMSAAMFSGDKQKANILRGPMAAQFVIRLLKQADWGDLDYLLLDYPPGTGDIQLSISQNTKLSGAVIVSTPQQLALQDAKKAITMFSTLKVPVLGMVETMSYFVCDGCDKKHFIFGENGTKDLAKKLGYSFLGSVALEQKLTQSADSGNMLDFSQDMILEHYLKISENLQNSLKKSSNKSILASFKLMWRS